MEPPNRDKVFSDYDWYRYDWYASKYPKRQTTSLEEEDTALLPSEADQAAWVDSLIEFKATYTPTADSRPPSSPDEQPRIKHLVALELAKKKPDNDKEVREKYKVLCEKICPQDISLWRDYLNFEKDKMDSNEFKKLIELALQLNPCNVDILTVYAEYHYLENDLQAMKALMASLKDLPLDSTLKIHLYDIRLAFRKGNDGYALSELNKIIAATLPSPPYEVVKLKVYILCVLKKFADAKNLLYSLWKRKPSAGLDHLLYLQIYSYESSLNPKSCRNITDELKALGENLSYLVYDKAGDIAFFQGDYMKAFILYGNALETCPANDKWKLLLKRARVCLCKQMWMDELHIINKELLENYPSNFFEIQIDMAKQNEFLGKKEEALKIYKQLLLKVTVDHQRKKLFMNLLSFYLRTNQLVEGIKAGEFVLKECPDLAWMVIQLKALHGDSDVLEFALKYESISERNGYYWCERARIHLNPLSPHFSVDAADKCFRKTKYSLNNTDRIFENVRLTLIRHGPSTSTGRMLVEYRTIKNREGIISSLYGANAFDHPDISYRKATQRIINDFKEFMPFYRTRKGTSKSVQDFHVCNTFLTKNCINRDPRKLQLGLRFSLIFQNANLSLS